MTYHNIERSYFRRGQYNGWSRDGLLYHIRKASSCGWEARIAPHHYERKDSLTFTYLRARTLREISLQLAGRA